MKMKALYVNHNDETFEGYYERVKTLSELYTNISDWFEEVE